MPEKIKDAKDVEALSMCLVHYKEWYLGREEEGEREAKKFEKMLIKIFDKYKI